MNVIREEKTFNPAQTVVQAGQININASAWPFIQLYNFNPTGQVVVVYNRGGGVQTTTLNFDTVDQFADLEIDRDVYPRGAHVHVTMTDLQLNIDPTDEDSWTFGTNVTNIGGTGAQDNFGLFYQVFDENGQVANDTATNPNIRNARPSLMFEDNGLLQLDPNFDNGINDIVNLFDNDKQNVTAGARASNATTTTIFALQGGLPVTMTELSSNNGIFGNYDEADDANIRVTTNADRGRSAVLEFNKDKTSIVQGFRSGKITLEVEDGEWNSGEEIPVILIDNDNNLNSRQDEDLDVFNPTVFNVPALIIDDPFTIDEDNQFDDNRPTTTVAFQGNKQKVLFLSNSMNFSLNGAMSNAALSTTGIVDQNSSTTDSLEFSGRILLGPNATDLTYGSMIIDLRTTMEKLLETINDPRQNADGTFKVAATTQKFHGFNLLNIDLRGLNNTALTAAGLVNVYLLNNTGGSGILTGTDIAGSAASNTDKNFKANYALASGVTAISLVNQTTALSLNNLNDTTSLSAADPNAVFKNTATSRLFNVTKTDDIGLLVNFTAITFNTNLSKKPIVIDFFSYGFLNDGIKDADRISHSITRYELEETGDNTSTFAGTAEFRMANQVSILDSKTYEVTTIDDEPEFVIIEDETDEDSPRISYRDRGTEGTLLRQGDQAGAPTHSGVVSFNAATYKIASPVTMTIDDTDLNSDVDLIDIYTPVNPNAVGGFPNDPARDLVGKEGLPVFSFGPLGKILDVTFNDQQWSTTSERTSGAGLKNCDPAPAGGAPGLFVAGTTMIETGPATGLFTANFKIPAQFCPDGGTTTTKLAPVTTTGLDLEVNYLDFRDASGQIIEVGDSAGVRANTGSISLDRTVYPVPFGEPNKFADSTETTPSLRSVFPVHQTGMQTTGSSILPGASPGLDTGEFIPRGDVQIHVRVNDPDFNVSPGGENQIRTNTTKAPSREFKTICC